MCDCLNCLSKYTCYCKCHQIACLYSFRNCISKRRWVLISYWAWTCHWHKVNRDDRAAATSLVVSLILSYATRRDQCALQVADGGLPRTQVSPCRVGFRTTHPVTTDVGGVFADTCVTQTVEGLGLESQSAACQ